MPDRLRRLSHETVYFLPNATVYFYHEETLLQCFPVDTICPRDRLHGGGGRGACRLH